MIDGLEVVHRYLAEQGDIDRVVGVVVAQHDVGDIVGGYAELLERVKDRCSGRDHPRVDNDDAVTVPDQADCAGHTVGGIASEQHVKTGCMSQTGQVVGSHELTVTAHRAVSYTHLRAHETVLDLVCRLLLEKK